MSSMTPTRPAPPRPGAPRPRTGTGSITAPGLDPFRVLRRHTLGIAASIVVGCVVGAVTWFILDRAYPLYTATALFEVQAGVAKPLEVGTRDIAQEDTVTRLAATETRLMVTRLVLEDALKSPAVRETQWAKKFTDAKGEFVIADAADDLGDDVAAAPIRNSNLFALRWATHWEQDAPIIVNAIADAYLIRRARQETEVFDKNQKVFQDTFNKTNRDIEDLREEISVFIREKGITALDDPRFNQNSLKAAELVRRIGVANEQHSMVQTSLTQASAKLEGTLAPSAEDRFIAERDGIIQRQDLDILNLKTELSRVRAQYKDPNHPAIINIERSLRAYEEQRDTAVRNIINRNLDAQLKDLSNQKTVIEELLRGLLTEYNATDNLLRDLAADMSRYLDMEKRRDLLELKRNDDSRLMQELQLMRLRADAARIRQVDRAITPREKSFPLPELVIPLVALLIVGLTIGGIFAFELMDTRVKTAADLAIVPGARVLGVIPDAEEDPTGAPAPELVVRKHPQSVLAESYRQTFAVITKALAMGDHQSLLLVGGMPDAGTTTVATNLAAACAAAGKRVVLVDANFRRSGLAQSLGVSADGPGLGDLLGKAATLDQVVTHVDDGIDLIRAGTPASRVFERLHTSQLASVLAELRDRYDLIIIDTPPAVVAGEAISLASRVDAAVLVVRAQQEERGLVARLINQLADTQCDLLGVILNRARGTVGGYFKKNFATMAEYAQSSGT